MTTGHPQLYVELIRPCRTYTTCSSGAWQRSQTSFGKDWIGANKTQSALALRQPNSLTPCTAWPNCFVWMYNCRLAWAITHIANAIPRRKSTNVICTPDWDHTFMLTNSSFASTALLVVMSCEKSASWGKWGEWNNRKQESLQTKQIGFLLATQDGGYIVQWGGEGD